MNIRFKLVSWVKEVLVLLRRSALRLLLAWIGIVSQIFGVDLATTLFSYSFIASSVSGMTAVVAASRLATMLVTTLLLLDVLNHAICRTLVV